MNTTELGYSYQGSIGSLVDVGIDYNNIEKIQIENNIFIYKNLFADLDEFIKLLKKSEENSENSCLFKNWKPWGNFGTYILWNGLGLTQDDIDNKPEVYKKEHKFLDMVNNAFYFSTDDFVKNIVGKVPEDWVIMGPSISKYDYNINNNSDLSMSFHTDYKYLEADWPQPQMILTCTMYLNDDYDGGEIIFKLPDKKLLPYKPVKGDVIVFPSGNPEFLSKNGLYFHAVGKSSKNDRYLVRCFYQKNYDGSEYWYNGIKEYGEELWKKMEQERVNKKIQVKDNNDN
jgi:hypothetical protein